MKTSLKMGIALKTGVAALALCMLTGNAWAEGSCARPREMTALRIAALQQRLMVAALACHDAADYNRFVVSHQRELQESDRTLKSFFLRQDAQKGADDYSTYKTGLANDSSLRSARDPRFCRGAKAAFGDEFQHQVSLAESVSQRASLIKTGYESCAPDARENTMMADAAPGLPARHQALPDTEPSDLDPNLTSRMDRALPPLRRDEGALMPPRGDTRYAKPNPARDTYEGGADNRNGYAPDAGDRDPEEQDDVDNDGAEGQYAPDVGDDAPRYDPEYADRTPPRAHGRNDDRNGDGYGQSYRDGRGDNVEGRGGYDDGLAANNAPGDERDGYDGPYVRRPHTDRPYTYQRPVPPRFVRGPDGRWYLLRRRY